MARNFLCKALALLAVAILLAGEAYADTFEFLTYTPPPGWVKQTLPDAVAYQRPNGIGLITFYASYPANSSATDEFAKMWRAQVEPAVPGPAPQPQLQRDGDYTVAVGARQIEAQGAPTTLALAAIVGQGRTIGVLTTSAGDEAFREVAAFLDSIKIIPRASTTPGAAPATPGQKPGSVPAGEIEVDFDVPPGYAARRDGGMVVLTPTTIDEQTPCAYGITPPRPSNGMLDADARAALLDVQRGWQIKSDSYNAMRGTAGAGWPYFWFRTDIQRLVAGSYEYATAMTMAFPAAPVEGNRGKRVHIVWGVGNPARCTLDDLAFVRLFHSLRPRGLSSDNGTALSQNLRGTWRNSQRAGIAQYKFMDNGRYEFGIGTVTTMGLLERTSASVSDGRYEVRGAELTITPDRRDRGVSRYRVRIYDEFVLGRWTSAMSLLNENEKPPSEVQYMRVE